MPDCLWQEALNNKSEHYATHFAAFSLSRDIFYYIEAVETIIQVCKKKLPLIYFLSHEICINLVSASSPVEDYLCEQVDC
jgi:hypothetical protein